MSNTLAIATVTATLEQIVNGALETSGVNGAVITKARPDDTTNLPTVGVNIFLYQVTPNPTLRNADLPTRRADGSLLRRPQVALDLHYLLTFHGDDKTLETQLLMGAALLKLHAAPVLTRTKVQQAVQSNADVLNKSDLADATDPVRITPANMSLDELNKLWMMFPDAAYVLSAVYIASVVLIETDDLPPGSAPPVLRPCVTAVPFSLATIDSVTPQPVDLTSPPAPTAITLVGNNLDPTSVVTFNTPGQSASLTGTVQLGSGGSQLIVYLPAGLHAGVNTVRLTQMAQDPPSPPTSPLCSPHVISQSNAAAFILRPSIIGDIMHGSLPGELIVKVAPLVGPQQQVTLLLNQMTDLAPLAFALPAAAHPTETDTLVFTDVVSAPSASVPAMGPQPISIPSGTYLARIRVDDAESMLETNPITRTFIGPTVNV